MKYNKILSTHTPSQSETGSQDNGVRQRRWCHGPTHGKGPPEAWKGRRRTSISARRVPSQKQGHRTTLNVSEGSEHPSLAINVN